MKKKINTPSLDIERPQSLVIHGTSISLGLAQGVLHLQSRLLGPSDVLVNIAQHNVEEEFYRLDQATAKIYEDVLEFGSIGSHAALFTRQMERMASAFIAWNNSD